MPPIEGHEIGQTEQKKDNNLGSWLFLVVVRMYYSVFKGRPGNEKAGINSGDTRTWTIVRSVFPMLPFVERSLRRTDGNSVWRATLSGERSGILPPLPKSVKGLISFCGIRI